MSQLNLGCGRFKKRGFVNVDGDPACEPDVVHDLNRFPYPFDDESFSRIEADHVLEHLDEPMRAMAEMRRLLSPGGRLIIRVPHFSRGFTHPEHRRGFDVSYPLYFDPGFAGGYSGVHLEFEGLAMHWFAQPYLKRAVLTPFQFWSGFLLGRVLDVLARVSPYACARVWCFWVGGFEEVVFRFSRPAAQEPGRR